MLDAVAAIPGLYVQAWPEVATGISRLWSGPPPPPPEPPAPWWIMRTLTAAYCYFFCAEQQSAGAKAAKEAFVTGLDGQTWWETAATTFLLPVLLSVRLQLPRARPVGGRSPAHTLSLLGDAFLDFLVVAAPLALVLMGFAPPFGMLLLAATASAALLASRPLLPASLAPARKSLASVLRALGQPRKAPVATARAALLAFVSLAILGVDFRAFPRRFAKTEYTGTSLMDVGVGMFVVAAALSSRQLPARKNAVASRLRAAAAKSAPLLALGVMRAVAVKFLAYQSHVGEYGVHWNFFLTQACVVALTSLVSLPPSALLSLGATVLALHQAALTAGGLTQLAFAEHVVSEGWARQNKEGIVSLPGFWALQMMSIGLGHNLLSAMERTALTVSLHRLDSARMADKALMHDSHAVNNTNTNSNINTNADPVDIKASADAADVIADAATATAHATDDAQPARPPADPPLPSASASFGSKELSMTNAHNASHISPQLAWAAARLVARLGGVAVVLWLGAAVASHYVESVSRRTCNAAYVLWVLALSVGHLGAYLLVDIFLGPTSPCNLVVALSDNLLPVFLISNLLTGAVNLTIDTLTVGDRAALGIVLLYFLAVWGSGVAFAYLRATKMP